MAVLKYILPPLLALGLTACYENFNPRITSSPVLCINSLITPGEPIAVSVTHTWAYNNPVGEQDHSVGDAIVLIYANGELAAPDYLPAQGDEIRIVAESDTYGRAEATVTVPVAVPIAEASLTPELLYSDPGPNLYAGFNMRVALTVDDPADADHFYSLNYGWWFSCHDVTRFNPGTLNYEAEPIFREHIGVFESIFSDDDPGTTMIFSDRRFDGKKYTLNLYFNDSSFSRPAITGDEAYDEPDCELTFYLSTLSRSFYDYTMYVWQRDDGTIGDMATLGFAEPMWGYSNVSTGAGVVAARSTSAVTLSLTPFLRSVFFTD